MTDPKAIAAYITDEFMPAHMALPADDRPPYNAAIFDALYGRFPDAKPHEIKAAFAMVSSQVSRFFGPGGRA